ncbi:MAG: TIGR00730 family Rossman fold protein [Oligoflexia bacterium]|nr:TIGR00730 family Rossman fold protein [Oligoflexia bacterium]
MEPFRRICVYCASSNDVHERWRQVARETGRLLASANIAVVYGGGCVGLMGELADAALATGGQVFGVIPQRLMAAELGHDGLTELFVVDSMHARKAMMARLSDAFMALPGGFGTLEEIFEATTWTQLGYHDKPVGLVDAHGYYQPIIQFVQQATELGFIHQQDRDMLLSAETPAALLATLQAAELPVRPRWLGGAER